MSPPFRPRRSAFRALSRARVGLASGSQDGFPRGGRKCHATHRTITTAGRAGPFLHSLKTKFIAALILLVGVVIGLSTWWNLSLHTGHMVQATEDKVRALADAIDGGIQVAMREGHTTEVQRILEGMARDPDIERIVIFDDGGRDPTGLQAGTWSDGSWTATGCPGIWRSRISR